MLTIRMPVSPVQITETIRAIGVRAGDLLIVHSSFKSFGGVEGGPEAVAEALIDAISPAGSIFMPTFNYGELPYDSRTTRSLTGAITEAFRKLPGVIRSDHPTHPVAGFGPDAAQILRDHQPMSVFGASSPLWRLWERNAWVLLMGCDHRANSMIHVAEELVAVPYVKRKRFARVIRDGAEVSVEVRRPGCSANFNVVDHHLRDERTIIAAKIGSSSLLLMRAIDLVHVAGEMLRADPAALLCPRGTCPVCDEARQMR